jgi:hypothetical protein
MPRMGSDTFGKMLKWASRTCGFALLLVACESSSVVVDGGQDHASDVGGDCELTLTQLVDSVDHGCAATYEAALASLKCNGGWNGENAVAGTCDSFLVFSYGHDGLTICTYDSSSHTLVGGTLCGSHYILPQSCEYCSSVGTNTASMDPLTDQPVCHGAGELSSACVTDAGAE